MRQTTHKQVQLRLPKEQIEFIKSVAKLAEVTPTEVFRVMLAFSILHMQSKVRK